MRLVPERSLRCSRRGLAVAALALVALTAGPAYAQRDDQGLQLGCANDYFRLCAGVDPNSQDADRCMTRNRKRLSPECRAGTASCTTRRIGSRCRAGA